MFPLKRAEALGRAVGRFLVDSILLRLFPRTAVRLAFHILVMPGLVNHLLPASRDRLRQILTTEDDTAQDSGAASDERQESYAQEGEDLVIARILGERREGFYIDVGAHHPTRHSNTYRLYRRGWRGINIDATPGSMELFRRVRPRDINIECLVASDPSPRPFYILNEPALNTASEDLARLRPVEDRYYRVTETVSLKPRTLAAILDELLPKGQVIDLLSVDVEGLDLDVLRTNDWRRYRPELLLVELLATELEELAQHEVVCYLRDQGFRPIAKLYNTVVFRQITVAPPAPE